MKRNSLSKLLRRIACALAALVIALAVAVFALWLSLIHISEPTRH